MGYKSKNTINKNCVYLAFCLPGCYYILFAKEIIKEKCNCDKNNYKIELKNKFYNYPLLQLRTISKSVYIHFIPVNHIFKRLTALREKKCHDVCNCYAVVLTVLSSALF